MRSALAIIVAAALCVSAGADVQVTRGNLDDDANEEIGIDNGLISVVVDPAMGGVITSLEYRGTELTRDGGVLEDHLWGQEPFQGDWYRKPYIAQVKELDDRVEVTLSRTGETGDLKFIEISKTITIREGRQDIEVAYAYRNLPRSMAELEIHPWFHHTLVGEGVNTYYIPTTEGVLERVYDPEAETAQEFYRSPARGWIGCIGENGVGVVCAMDYPYLESLYTFFGQKTFANAEWRFVPVSVKEGEEFTTSFTIMPFEGLPALHGAGGGLAGALTIHEGTSRATIDLLAAQSTQARIATGARDLASGEIEAVAEMVVALEPNRVQQIGLDLPTGDTDVELRAQVLAEGGLLMDMCRPWLRAGEARYALEPLEERVRMAADEAPWRYLLSYDVETPHVELARPLAGGPLGAFFALDIETMRDVVELHQRIDLEAHHGTLIAVDGADRFTWWIDPKLGKPREARKRGLEALAGDIEAAGELDVIVIGDRWRRRYNRHELSWQTLPPDAREAILDRVRAGAGLVYVSPQDADGELAEAIARAQPLTAEDWITAGFPFDELRRPSGPDRIRTTELGEGRIVVIDTGGWGVCSYSWPFEYDFAHQELEYSLVARAMLWAAGREPEQGLGPMRVAGEGLQIDMAGPPPAGRSVMVTFWRHKSETLAQSRLDVPEGSRSVTLPIPTDVPDGRSFATARLLDADGTVVDWRTQRIEVERALSIAEVRLPVEAADPGDEVTVTVSVTNASQAPAEAVVELSLTDGWGRLMQQETIPVSVPAAGAEPGRTEARGSLTITDPITVKHTVAAEVSVGGRLMARESATLFVPEAHGPKEPFHLLLWGGPDGTAVHAYTEALRQARRMGFDVTHSGTNVYLDTHSQFAPEANMRLNLCNILRTVITNHAILADWQETRDRSLLVRQPCLQDPQYRREVIETRLHMAAETVRNYGPLSYQLGDEMSLTTEGGGSPFDICFSEWCLAGFRDRLRQRFGTIDRLNAAWHTDWASFEAIVPDTWEEAVEKRNASSWLAHRDYMNTVYAEWFRFCRDSIREIDPDALVGESGIQPKFSAYGGYDWSKRMAYENVVSFYGTGDVPISFGDRDGSMLGSWSIGYCDIEENERSDIWRALLHGQNQLSYWYIKLMVDPDLTLTPYGEFIKPMLQEVSRGPGQMLGHADYQWSPVAIHHSMLSCELSFFLKHISEVDTYRTWTENVTEWNDELRKWGWAPRFVSDTQIEAGELIDRGYRVLVMPLSFVLSEREAEQITRFVEAGGIVIADAQTGLYDQFGQPRAAGALDELLGVTRSGSKLTLEGADYTEASGERIRAAVSETGVRTSGRALATGAGRTIEFGGMRVRFGGGGAAADIGIRDVGGGRAIYLAGSKFDFSTERGSFLREMLRDLGLEPELAITTPDGAPVPAEIGRFEEGGVTYAGALLLPAHAPRGGLPDPVTVTLPAAGHVYEVRSGRYLGEGRTVTDSIEPGVARLYAILPEQPSLDVAAPDTAQRGGALELRLTADAAGDYPVRVELIGPDGEPREWHERVVFATQAGEPVTAPLALNAAPGPWTVRLTEVITGNVTERTVEVQ